RPGRQALGLFLPYFPLSPPQESAQNYLFTRHNLLPANDSDHLAPSLCVFPTVRKYTMVIAAKVLLESGDPHCPEVPNAESATKRPHMVGRILISPVDVVRAPELYRRDVPDRWSRQQRNRGVRRRFDPEVFQCRESIIRSSA